MKAALWIAVLLCPLTLPCAALSAAASATAPVAAQSRRSLSTQIDAVIRQPRYAAADWGIAVASLDSGRTLYAHQSGKLFEPASTAKLFTAALTMETLDPQSRIPTRLLSAAPIRHARLDGPLLLYGMGDPTLGTPGANPDWADDLAAQLAARGIEEVHGDLVADATYFSGPPLGKGWEASDLLGWFAAPASALSVHENTVALTVTPATVAGQPPQLSFAPGVAAPPLASTLTTAPPRTPDDFNLYRAPGDALLHAFGSIAEGAAARTYQLAIPDPAQQAGEELRAALARHGIRLTGGLRVLAWPERDDALRANAKVLAEVLSPPVSGILAQGLKRSQNLYLQNLLQLDGISAQAAAANQPGAPIGFLSSEAWGLRALHDLLERIDIAPSSVLMEEGSGLSRSDLVTPAAMTRLLQVIAMQPWAGALQAMLPVGGVDGTLEWRMRDGAATDNVHAKTGSMAYVHCIAGYVTAADGQRLAFTIMLNNYRRDDGEPSANHDVDAIVQLLAGWRGSD
ncbi:D-alanyl-D-alanine carboxypeptidase/D-alanyl-D-alanine endopeptidase [Rhodanobacter hydrolyticus]|uniref:D-alanyl-D-alanine carboxypeptidase/D-alanyl-D-alanine-endopeptidase n=1 Tax=Rhodanobacter hydrolyticus TaxID=2250595 RepID=A0ABW8J7C1_9GAMM